MDVNNMVAAMAAKTVDAMVNVEPYNTIAEAEGFATTIIDFRTRRQDACVHGRHAGVRGQDPDAVVAYLKAWLDVARDFKEQPRTKWPTPSTASTPPRATPCRRRRSAKRWPPSTWNPASPGPGTLHERHAEVLLKEKKIAAIPDWSKALRPDFLERARKGP